MLLVPNPTESPYWPAASKSKTWRRNLPCFTTMLQSQSIRILLEYYKRFWVALQSPGIWPSKSSTCHKTQWILVHTSSNAESSANYLERKNKGERSYKSQFTIHSAHFTIWIMWWEGKRGKKSTPFYVLPLDGHKSAQSRRKVNTRLLKKHKLQKPF